MQTARADAPFRAALAALDALTFAEASLRGRDAVLLHAPALRPLVEHVAALRDAGQSADARLHVLVLDLAAAIPLPFDDARARDHAARFENSLPDLYLKYAVGDVARFGAARARLCPAAAPPPARWLWATFYAHLRVAADRLGEGPVPADRPDDAGRLVPGYHSDATYICAKFAGDAFTVFALALLCVQRACGLDPPGLGALLDYYVHSLDTLHSGRVPPAFLA